MNFWKIILLWISVAQKLLLIRKIIDCQKNRIRDLEKRLRSLDEMQAKIKKLEAENQRLKDAIQWTIDQINDEAVTDIVGILEKVLEK